VCANTHVQEIAGLAEGELEGMPKDHATPLSPELYILDYSVWAANQRTTCTTCKSNLEELKAMVLMACANLSKNSILKFCSSFRRHVEAVIKAKSMTCKD